ncbi:MAG TPA: ribosome biogenesis GTP-binding protein YihA/YsxC [Vicinamibacterales bacterium]|jgi:GTP-binding protein|nr:ribosome biogenesis GTP-binding protein YihA/YsxC [Vicinamibacterales bacterium]
MQVAAEFITSAASANDFPRDGLPEVAFVGRSNVGKSSLINALVRRPVARTSAAPGKTRLANIYRVQRGSMPPLYLVDLPGYGYARAPRPGSGEARGLAGQRARDAAVQDFDVLVDAYFRRPAIRAVLLLVDARHPGLESDLDAARWLRSQRGGLGIVGTKVDKLTRTERARHTRELETLFDLPVALVSARTGEGLDDLWKMIASLPRTTAA